MAGTRRRSRMRDTATAQQNLRSASRTASASVLAASDAPAPAPSVEVEPAGAVDSIDISSSSPAPANRSTTGFCRRCNGNVGEFYNAWHKITGTYYLPALLGSYSSRLRPHGRQTAATDGTDLDSCQIQPLACPSCSSEILGFTVVDAPESKQSFRGRDFFKLPRIDLKCEVAPKQFRPVEPQVDAAPDPLPVDESDRSSPVPVIIPPADDMEVDTRPPHTSQPPPSLSGPLQHPRHHEPQHREHQHHQPLQQVEVNRQSLPPPAIRSPGAPLPNHSLPQKSPSIPLPSPSPAVKPVHDVPYSQPPPKEGSVGLANRTRDLPPVMSHSHSPAEQHRANGQHYPRSPQEVQLDAIERLQTQISQNSSALVAHGRDLRHSEETLKHQEDSLRREFQTTIHHQNLELRRVDDAVGRLQHETRGIRELLESLTRDVQAVRSGGSGLGGVSAQDSALELMANQVSAAAAKATEVDALKLTIEIMKNKIQRLEDSSVSTAAAPPPTQQQQQHSQPSSHHFPSPREHPAPSAPSAHSTHTVPSYHSTPTTVPHIQTPVHPAHRPASFQSHGSRPAATPEASQRAEPAPTQGGWVTVNASAKRSHPGVIDSPHDPIGQPVGSPKRPKLAPIEPRVAYENSQQGHPHQQHIVYEHMDTDDSESKVLTHSHSLPSHVHSRESIPYSTLPSQHAGFVPYDTQEAPSDDSWRPESQRIGEHHPRPSRGRGSRGGPGSRGGRGRKSLPAQVLLGTPEWEREDWQGVTESQTSPDGYYSHSAGRGRGILRRGSGGGGTPTRAQRPDSAGRAVSLGLQGVTPGITYASIPGGDPYAHTKKTRTKPTRNADGVLIRKDGRPDKRSQSSAANLRKVHAMKEGQKSSERSFTPTSSLQHATGLSTETPSPVSYGPDGQELTQSVQKKHTHIMGKMFPGGIDESRRELDYSRKVFEEGEDHTAHPRNQHHHHHHHHHHHQAPTSPLQIKCEQVEDRRALDSESPAEGDVDMDRAEDHADDEGHTPSGQSDNSGRETQYHDAPTNEEQPKDLQTNGVPPSVAESSQTLDTATVDTGTVY
ncbi:hypothetical protein BDV96DRAFT_585598 [Lophiotrema nucula]|uniref:Uncharacterized protein n=1 Tax=Lophiotrema nucula TaxID=690887 RepID=A0A6A5YTM0_9PLEO|nr:hypothetical protein BDV96DRAFT_585598 [Lophiotrema nucula]